MTACFDVEYSDVLGIPVRLYRPPGSGSDPAPAGKRYRCTPSGRTGTTSR